MLPVYHARSFDQPINCLCVYPCKSPVHLTYLSTVCVSTRVNHPFIRPTYQLSVCYPCNSPVHRTPLIYLPFNCMCYFTGQQVNTAVPFISDKKYCCLLAIPILLFPSIPLPQADRTVRVDGQRLAPSYACIIMYY